MHQPIEIHQKLKLNPAVLNIIQAYKWTSIEIENDRHVQVVSEKLGILRKQIKEIEKDRDRVLNPLKKATQELRSMANDILLPFKKIESDLKQKLGTYWTAQRKRVEQEATDKRAKEIETERKKAALALDTSIKTGSSVAFEESEQREKNIERLESKEINASQTVRGETVTVAETTYYEWWVEDESTVPDKYWVIDQKELNRIARSYGKNKIVITGIAFERRSRVAVGA